MKGILEHQKFTRKLSHNEPAFSRIFFSVLFCENSVTLSRYSCFVRLSFLSPNGFILRNNSCAAFLALFSSSGVFMHQVTSSKLLSSTPEITSGRKSIYKGLQGLHRPQQNQCRDCSLHRSKVLMFPCDVEKVHNFFTLVDWQQVNSNLL